MRRQTLRCFLGLRAPGEGWHASGATSGRAAAPDVVTTGGTGFGIMVIIAGVERAWIGRAAAVRRLLKAVRFLGRADRYSAEDDGADLVETSFLRMLLQGGQHLPREAAEAAHLALFVREDTVT